MTKSALLAERTYTDLKQQLPQVVVLPFGATEPHNGHLPYGTDCFEADALGQAACQQANAQGANTLCLPTIPYGTQTNHRGLPLSMNLNPSTLLAILKDLVQTVSDSGVQKMLILNCHGGNEFKGHLRELLGTTNVHLFLCNFFQMAKNQYHNIFENPDDHAGEMETSLLLHLRPDLVHLQHADAGQTRPSRFNALNQGWIQMSRPWTLLTTNTGAGDPRQASAEKGKQWMKIIVDQLADFLTELSNSTVDETFPFASPDN